MKFSLFSLAAIFWSFGFDPVADAVESGELEFSEPAITSDPTPGTQIRLNHIYRDEFDGERQVAELELEVALAPWVSLGVAVPYVFHDPDQGNGRQNLDNLEVELKLASYRFADSGVVLGAGLGLELPTGQDPKNIGSNNEIGFEPYVAIGAKSGGLETISVVRFGIPVNQSSDARDEIDLEVGFNAVVLYHATSRHRVFLEFDGEIGVQGREEEMVVNGTAGLLWTPFSNEDFSLGFGASIPLSDDEDFGVQTVLWTSYEF